MQFSQLFADDERAVTPVIGIVLMVAVAVILAALIAPQLLSISRNSAEAGPSSVIKFDYDASVDPDTTDSWGDSATATDYDGLLTISHTDGESIPLDRLDLRGVTDRPGLEFSDPSITGTGLDDGQFNPGDEVSVWVKADDTVRVVWDSREGTKTTAVAVWDSGE